MSVPEEFEKYAKNLQEAAEKTLNEAKNGLSEVKNLVISNATGKTPVLEDSAKKLK